MKRLKKKQLGPWCSYCPPKTVRAIFRQDGFMGKFCCNDHKENLKNEEEKTNHNYLTEADRQTWMRI